MLRYNVPDDAAQLVSERCKTLIWSPAPNVILNVASGYGDAEMASLMEAQWERLISVTQAAIIMFDGLEFPSYEPAFRVHLVEYIKAKLASGQIERLYVLTRSQLVAMGAAVANLAFGSRLEVIATAARFDAQLVALGASSALLQLPTSYKTRATG